MPQVPETVVGPEEDNREGEFAGVDGGGVMLGPGVKRALILVL